MHRPERTEPNQGTEKVARPKARRGVEHQDQAAGCCFIRPADLEVLVRALRDHEEHCAACQDEAPCDMREALHSAVMSAKHMPSTPAPDEATGVPGCHTYPESLS